jgi:hypothetical protein
MGQKKIKRRGVGYNRPEKYTRRIGMTPEMREAMERQLERFRQKFGRDAGPNDPIFFDPNSDVPKPFTLSQRQEVTEKIVAAMEKAGISPADIYAYRKTGILLTEDNRDKWSQSDIREYEDAYEEYERQPGRGQKLKGKEDQ